MCKRLLFRTYDDALPVHREVVAPLLPPPNFQMRSAIVSGSLPAVLFGQAHHPGHLLEVAIESEDLRHS